MTEVLTRWQNMVGCTHFWCASSGESDNLRSSFRTRFFMPLLVNGFPQSVSLRTARTELERTFGERIYSNSRTELLRVHCCPLAGQCQKVIRREINLSRFNDDSCPFKCRQASAGFTGTWSLSFDSVNFSVRNYFGSWHRNLESLFYYLRMLLYFYLIYIFMKKISISKFT